MTEAEGQEYRIALAGSLPGEGANGWDDDLLKESLFQDRARIRYARIAYNVLHAREVTATGKRVLTLGIARVEPIPEAMSTVEERQMLQLFETRTGQGSLFSSAAADDGTVGFDEDVIAANPQWQEPTSA